MTLGSDDPRHGTMGTRVFDALRQAIVELRLKPGNLLSEAEVARQLGVSRQPVREAFIKLAEVGLVEVRPQRGTFVRLISSREVHNVRFIREAVEVAVVRKAAQAASAGTREMLAQHLEAQRAVARKGDQTAFLRLDEAFHQALAHAADCDHAWGVLQNLKSQMDRVRYLSLPDATPIETVVGQHAEIVEAVGRSSADDAESAMRVHLGEITKSLPRIAAAHPELFAD